MTEVKSNDYLAAETDEIPSTPTFLIKVTFIKTNASAASFIKTVRL